MEWVETTGKTLEEAKDAALDQLGVDERDAEFDVLEEPRTGLFGRTRGDARVRARVRPTQPRPKVERRDRKGRGRGGRGGEQRAKRGGGSDARAPEASADGADVDGAVAASAEGSHDSTTEPKAQAVDGGDKRPSNGRRRGSQRGRDRNRDNGEETRKMTETELASQGEVVQTFLLDLLDAFGLDGDVSVTPVEDDDAVELAVTGSDLGLLIGPKGQTLQAVQELSRSVLQRQLPGEDHARIRVDVGGYRQRRKEALQRFVHQVAEDVRSSGVQKALEPMSPPDRKVVHDTVNEIDGVRTMSEGEDARRRVVIIPE